MKHLFRNRVWAIGSLLLFCFCNRSPDPDKGSCATNADCKQGEICQGSVCKAGSCSGPGCNSSQTPLANLGIPSSQSTHNHCGICLTDGNCPMGFVCVDGNCACPSAHPIQCNNHCVDTLTDSMNCGGCGVLCGAGKTCVQGLCKPMACTCSQAGQACGSSQGTCKTGVVQCDSSGVPHCIGEIGPTQELCDGLDNDCDGVVDNHLVDCQGAHQMCQAGHCLDDRSCGHGSCKNGLLCGSSQGTCKTGLTHCDEMGVSHCVGNVGPTQELCDGLDNDCDGVVDNHLVDCQGAHRFCHAGQCVDASSCGEGSCQSGVACGSSQGTCKTGLTQCDEMGVSHCVGNVGPTQELCDGLDNDCDGVVDNHLVDCQGAHQVCQGGQCVDNGSCQAGVSCGSSQGTCKTGLTQCDEMGVSHCVGNVGPTQELCDGLDNDCDGVVDNHLVDCQGAHQVCQSGQCVDNGSCQGGVACGSSQGTCKTGLTQCDGMGVSHCVGNVGPTQELCDGLDNDCDGVVDNHLVDCQGPHQACQSGHCVDTGYCHNGLCAPNDCQACIDTIPWTNNGNHVAATNQCSQLVTLDAGNQDRRNTCLAKCTALRAISNQLSDAQRQCLLDFCDSIETQIAAGLICVP